MTQNTKKPAARCLAAALLLPLLWAQPAHAVDLPLFLPYPKLDTKRWFVAHGWNNGSIQSCEWRKEALTPNEGNLRITLSDNGGNISDLGCGEIQTRERYGYGMYSARIRAASGSGLNTAFFTFIGPQHKQPHDEIDFEFLGKNTRKVQLNYYVNGKPQGEKMIELGFDASEAMHEYSFVWEPERIRWYIDGKLVHETEKGAIIPTHPSKIYLSLWSASPKVKSWLGPFEFTGEKHAEFSDVKFTALPETP